MHAPLAMTDPAASRDAGYATLAAGTVHDFRNLLTVILGNADLLLASLPASAPVRQLAQDILRSAQSASVLCGNLLAYSGVGKVARQAVDLSALAGEVVGLLPVYLADRVRLRTDLAADLPKVRGNAGQLRQVVLNLILNAAEAVRQGPGHIEVATRCAWSPGAGPEHPEGEYVVLEVSDDGHGMTADVRAKIFQPRFTTKKSGHGLGLALVAEVVVGHGGRIEVDSTPGAGTTFRIFLPTF